MYIATHKVVNNPLIRIIARVFVEEMGDVVNIYQISEKLVDFSMFLDYISNSATVELKDRTIKVFYKEQKDD